MHHNIPATIILIQDVSTNDVNAHLFNAHLFNAKMEASVNKEQVSFKFMVLLQKHFRISFLNMLRMAFNSLRRRTFNIHTVPCYHGYK